MRRPGTWCPLFPNRATATSCRRRVSGVVLCPIRWRGNVATRPADRRGNVRVPRSVLQDNSSPETAQRTPASNPPHRRGRNRDVAHRRKGETNTCGRVPPARDRIPARRGARPGAPPSNASWRRYRPLRWWLDWNMPMSKRNHFNHEWTPIHAKNRRAGKGFFCWPWLRNEWEHWRGNLMFRPVNLYRPPANLPSKCCLAERFWRNQRPWWS
ncbi:MAG: hypothetical protein BWX84_00905 [Verrucomicrobia bacterium ADurb.Bin118]|nr:MAG: hypothetical protein BWX84_00905 [Verrucomicrobia bacterium ADurb.Bin118]